MNCSPTMSSVEERKARQGGSVVLWLRAPKQAWKVACARAWAGKYFVAATYLGGCRTTLLKKNPRERRELLRGIQERSRFEVNCGMPAE